MSICLSRTTYKMYYPSELDPGKEGTTKGGYLEGELTLPSSWRPGTELLVSISCAPAEPLVWEPGEPPSLTTASDTSTDAADSVREEFHPCVPHLVYLERCGAGTRVTRARNTEPWFGSKHDQNMIKFPRKRELCINNVEDGVLDKETNTKIAEVVKDGDTRKIDLGHGDTKLNINLLIPKTKKIILSQKSVEPDEMRKIVEKEFGARNNGDSGGAKDAKITQIHQYFQSDNCDKLKRLRIKVSFTFSDAFNADFSVLSDIIQDKTTLVELHKPNILKCCSRGGRTVNLISKVVQCINYIVYVCFNGTLLEKPSQEPSTQVSCW